MLHRPLLLTGLPCSGKTTLGPLVAHLAQVPFVDLDEQIVQAAGTSIERIFREHGEAQFRRLERDLVTRHLDDPTPRIVALGGGALLDRDLRLHALRVATVITLDADDATLLSRLADAPSRPLLAAAPDEALQHLRLRRADAYAEAHARIETSSSASDKEAIARQILAAARHLDAVVAAGLRTYRVRTKRDDALLDDALTTLHPAPSAIFVVTDANVRPLIEPMLRGFARRAPTTVHTITPGETSKSPDGLLNGWAAMREARLDRGAVVVAIGGGVVSDLAGMLAGTWQRGVRWLSSPTTLLSMVDAAIGGKTAIDLGEAKNAVGVFHQPSGVLIDVRRVESEPTRGFLSGLAEAVKTALVGDAALLDRLEAHAPLVLARDLDEVEQVVRRCAAVKAAVVSRDERDDGDRRTLNLGHTFGHALEALGGYERWLHGEAVSLGLVAALHVGVSLGVTPSALRTRVVDLLARLGLPVDLSPLLANLPATLDRVSHDKKREASHVRFVLVERAGKTMQRLLTMNQLADALTA